MGPGCSPSQHARSGSGAAGSAPSSSHSKPGGAQVLAEVLLRLALVAGGVDGVEAQEPCEQLLGLGGQLRLAESPGARARGAHLTRSPHGGILRRSSRAAAAGARYWQDGHALRNRDWTGGGRGGGGEARACAPLAARVRPAALEDFVGQGHLLSSGAALRNALERGRAALDDPLRPAGLGQDDAGAHVRGLARRGSSRSTARSRSGLRGGARGAKRARARREQGQRTVFFLDEIHRFNKAQQDALLPAVEEGLVTLIGATTENPRLRGQRRAALAPARLRARAAAARTIVERLLRRAAGAGRASAQASPTRRVALLAGARGRRRARGARTRSSWRAPTRCAWRSRRRRAARGGRPAAACVLYDRAGDRTTTTSRPGSRPRAAPTRTPRSTTWR